MSDAVQVRRAVPLLLSLACMFWSGCDSFRTQIHADAVEELPYPTCGKAQLDAGEVIARGHLRSGPSSREENVAERFELRRRDCVYAMTVRQEWPLATADLEVIYDAQLRPIRAWKRLTLPGVRDADGLADIQRYELRTKRVGMKRHTRKDGMQYRIIPGPHPQAIIGPGRTLISMWIRAENLRVGEIVRRSVLDIREPFAAIKESALRREPDRHDPTLGRIVRVYTFYGRETVFTDDQGIVIGDLAGMRPSESLSTPEPPPMPMYGEPDPVNTP